MGAENPSCLLRAEAVSLSHGNQYSLSDINFSLNSGDTLGLLGLNGAGKSTLLRLLAGVNAPHSGRILIDGHDLIADPIAARRVLGYAPDKPPLYPEFSVTEFLRFAAELRGINKSQQQGAIAATLERCGLAKVQKRIIGNLSHGYQQRVNLAQALIHQPKVLILDEPCNGLDPAQLLEIRAVLADAMSEQATILSSHLLSEIQASCSRVIVLNNGSPVLDMPMHALADDNQQTFEVVLQQAAAADDMQDLPGVMSVCSVDKLRWLLTTRNAEQKKIGDALLARGMKLLEMHKVRNHLERVFSQLQLQQAGEPG